VFFKKFFRNVFGHALEKKISMEGQGFRFQGKSADARTWETNEGEVVGVYFCDLPPDLPEGQTTLRALLKRHRKNLEQMGADVVEVGYRQIQGVRSVFCISKVSRGPQRGFIYIGSLIIPFRECSFVVKSMFEESGTTGVREAVLLNRLMASGEVDVDDNGAIQGGWFPDDSSYDDEFPDHPLSKLRALFSKIERALCLQPDLLDQAPFLYPSC